MIKYQLRCPEDHQFEGWFRSSDDFDVQVEKQTLSCPVCGDDDIAKAIMSPAIATGAARREKRLAEISASMANIAEKARAYVEKNFDYVGERFPEEARKMYYGEQDNRPIYGEASIKEVKELSEEGVPIAPVPAAPVSAATKSPQGAAKVKPSNRIVRAGDPDSDELAAEKKKKMN